MCEPVVRRERVCVACNGLRCGARCAKPHARALCGLELEAANFPVFRRLLEREHASNVDQRQL